MRRFWLYLLAVILVAAAVVAVVLASESSKNHNDNKSSNVAKSTGSQTTEATKKACKIFTLADAKKLLGDTAKGGENSVTNSSEDISVSSCTYAQDQGSNAPISTSKSASLLVRSAKTAKGITSNHEEFNSLKPAGATDVNGYGDAAFWDSNHGQLDILKNDTWYILSYGPVTPNERSLSQTMQLADILINKM